MLMKDTQTLKTHLISILDILPLDSLSLLTEFAIFLKTKPDDLAKKLRQIQPPVVIELLQQALQQYQPIYGPSNDLVLLPPAPLPPFEPAMPDEKWKTMLLNVSVWTDEEIQGIEEAREYR